MDKSKDFVDFVTLLTGVADYYGKELSEGVISLYWQGLHQYDYAPVEKALWEHTQNPDNGQFMPRIADVTRNLQGRTQDQASIAWSKLDKAVRMVGTYRDVAFDDPLIHRVVSDMGGWIKFGTHTDDDWPFVAKDFESRYRGYRMRGDVPEYQNLLTGIANAKNALNGQPPQEPVFIGKPEKAKQVYLGGTDKPLLQINGMSSLIEKHTKFLE